jgi:hypothetical protein
VEINLVKASIENAEEIHQMQLILFQKLLEIYHDYDLNPGNEKIEETIARINENITDYYIRLVEQPGWLSNKSCKILCILPFLSGCYSETEVSE